MSYYSIKKEGWDKVLEQLILSYSVFATIRNEFGLDYELLRPEGIPHISYNIPKPVTPLKSFYLPVKEEVTKSRVNEKPRIILGTPNCDIEGLKLLDEIYLDAEYEDIFFIERRKNTILISSDCFSTAEHCHCTTYGIRPYSSETADLSIADIDGLILLRIISSKGENFIKKIEGVSRVDESSFISTVERKQKVTEGILRESNKDLPDSQTTGKRIITAGHDKWEKYFSDCVSCGACTAICPTCTCFLLIDKPGFGRVKQMDACQYPGFARVAGGEDPLHELSPRFRNRYMCKYVWKPKRFKSPACTGCGRCIEACIGKINKNKLFLELV